MQRRDGGDRGGGPPAADAGGRWGNGDGNRGDRNPADRNPGERRPGDRPAGDRPAWGERGRPEGPRTVPARPDGERGPGPETRDGRRWQDGSRHPDRNWHRDPGRDRNDGQDRGGNLDRNRGQDRGWDRNRQPPPSDWRVERDPRDRPGQGGRRQWRPHVYPPIYDSHHRFHGHPWRPPHGYYVRAWRYGEILPYGWYVPDYWITDWWNYDLPEPPPGYAWVRVGYDALLVEDYSGRIVQVVRLLFW
jgi:Ni/Co efflux regulator RcnB